MVETNGDAKFVRKEAKEFYVTTKEHRAIVPPCRAAPSVLRVLGTSSGDPAGGREEAIAFAYSTRPRLAGTRSDAHGGACAGTRRRLAKGRYSRVGTRVLPHSGLV